MEGELGPLAKEYEIEGTGSNRIRQHRDLAEIGKGREVGEGERDRNGEGERIAEG